MEVEGSAERLFSVSRIPCIVEPRTMLVRSWVGLDVVEVGKDELLVCGLQHRTILGGIYTK